MSFDKLMAELAQASESQETLRKALPTDGKDDSTIQAAAGEGGAGNEGGAAAGDGAGEGAADDGKGEGEGEGVQKSLQVTLEDGTKVEAIDGTAMVKALTDRMDATDGNVLKALDTAVNLLKGQGELIKSLSATVASQGVALKALGNEGRGRKAVLVANERTDTTDIAKGGLGAEGGMTGDELMAKAMAGNKAGKLMAHDVSMVENYLNRGTTPPANLVAKILAASA